MRDSVAVDAAHVAGGAGGHKHVPRCQFAGRRGKIEQTFLGSEHDTMFRLGINFQLGMVRPEMALAAGAGQARHLNRRSVARVASGAVADGSIGIGTTDRVTTRATALRRRGAFERGQRVGRPFDAAGLVLLGKRDLLWGKILVAGYGGPGGGRVTAAQELLINGLVTGAAIRGRHSRVNHETVMILSTLSRPHLVTVETIDPFGRMRTQLEFVDNRVLRVPMALGALATRPNEGRAGLFDHHARTARIHQIRRDDHRGGDRDSYEFGAEIHVLPNTSRKRRSLSKKYCAKGARTFDSAGPTSDSSGVEGC